MKDVNAFQIAGRHTVPNNSHYSSIKNSVNQQLHHKIGESNDKGGDPTRYYATSIPTYEASEAGKAIDDQNKRERTVLHNSRLPIPEGSWHYNVKAISDSKGPDEAITDVVNDDDILEVI